MRFAGEAGFDPYKWKGALLDMRALALIIILVGAVLVVVTRFRRNTPGAIVAYAVLGVGLVLGALSR
jgi:preprotein translocase subunit SecF